MSRNILNDVAFLVMGAFIGSAVSVISFVAMYLLVPALGL